MDELHPHAGVTNERVLQHLLECDALGGALLYHERDLWTH